MRVNDSIAEASLKSGAMPEPIRDDNSAATKTDEELGAAASGGCASSFSILHQRYTPRLTSFLKLRARAARLEVDDIVQESFVRAWRYASSYNANHRYKAWLYTIALRVAADLKKKQDRLPASNEDYHLDHLRHPTDSRSPSVGEGDFRVGSQEDSIWFDAQRILGQSAYSILWLRYAEDMSIVEIAKTMSKTRVGVRVALHRARSRLREHLEQNGNSARTIQDEY